ncbi:MAG: hypothetical protein K5866_08440 [Treponema sp.]|nr:hypothetical protein [Treponema sp.]
MKKIMTIAAAILSLGLIFTSCTKKEGKTSGSANSEPVTVEIWHTYNGTQQECLNQMAEDFNASQSKYIVKIMAQDYKGFADTVYNAVANKIGPSIIFN